MKITKTQLREIIKEELARVIEALTPDDMFSQAQAAVAGKIDFFGEPTTEENLKQALATVIDGIELSRGPAEGEEPITVVRDRLIDNLLDKPDARENFFNPGRFGWHEEFLDDVYGDLLPDWAEPWHDAFTRYGAAGKIIRKIQKAIMAQEPSSPTSPYPPVTLEGK